MRRVIKEFLHNIKNEIIASPDENFEKQVDLSKRRLINFVNGIHAEVLMSDTFAEIEVEDSKGHVFNEIVQKDR